MVQRVTIETAQQKESRYYPPKTIIAVLVGDQKQGET